MSNGHARGCPVKGSTKIRWADEKCRASLLLKELSRAGMRNAAAMPDQS